MQGGKASVGGDNGRGPNRGDSLSIGDAAAARMMHPWGCLCTCMLSLRTYSCPIHAARAKVGQIWNRPLAGTPLRPPSPVCSSDTNGRSRRRRIGASPAPTASTCACPSQPGSGSAGCAARRRLAAREAQKQPVRTMPRPSTQTSRRELLLCYYCCAVYRGKGSCA